MISFSFNRSPHINTCLTQIDHFRSEILLTPMPPAKQLELAWKCTTGYLDSWSLMLGKEAPSQVKMKRAFDYVRQSWTGASASVSLEAVTVLDEILGSKGGKARETEKLLSYVASGNVHPILQAAISHLHFAPSSPLAFFVPLFFVYRAGYDCHSMVCLDGFWQQNRQTYDELVARNHRLASITSWLEFYCEAGAHEYGIAHRAVMHHQAETPAGTWTLSDRQKIILTALEQPGASITTREVQRRFHISQVTASRDLTKLSTLNMVYPHGRGRSVYYTRV